MSAIQADILTLLRKARDPMTADDIADRLDSTVGSIRSQICKLRAAMRAAGENEQVVSIGRGYAVRRKP